MSQPDALLEDLTPADRNLLDRKLNQGMVRATAIFVPAVLLAFLALYVANTIYREHFRTEVLGFLNLLLVIIGAFAGRIYVGHCLNFFKDKNAFQKKVYRGVVTAKEGNRVMINSHELKIGKEHYDILQQGMRVEVHLSMKTGIVLNVTRL
jgi:hypothetical protein